MGLGVAACSDDDGGADVTATLTEFSVTPEPASVDAGSVTIKADNVGALTHELVLVRAADAADLPTDNDGAVDEEAFETAGVEAIGEVEDVESGTSKDLTADLEAGTYVVFCNVVETDPEAAVESHFAEGMVATLVVN
jgi:hypothetical protein